MYIRIVHIVRICYLVRYCSKGFKGFSLFENSQIKFDVAQNTAAIFGRSSFSFLGGKGQGGSEESVAKAHLQL